MKRALLLGTLFLILSIFIGCDNGLSTKGGNGAIVSRNKTTIINSDATVKTIETETVVNLTQPNNPNGNGHIQYETKSDGTFQINVNTGGSFNVANIVAGANLLKIPMYAGIALIPIALAVGYFTRNIKWALIIGLSGAGMIAGSYFLSQYAVYFLGLLGVLFIFGAYLLYDYYRQAKANIENVKLIDKARELGVIDQEKFKKLAEQPGVQSKSTKKIVRHIKDIS